MCSRLLKSYETSLSNGHKVLSWRGDVMYGSPSLDHDRVARTLQANIVAEARARAEAILQEALEAAAEITRQAHEQGWAKGHADGYKAGVEEAQALIDEAKAELRLARDEKARVMSSAEREIANLAISIASLILKREVQIDPETVLSLVRDALARVRDEDSVTVRVNPIDAVVVRSHMNALLSGTGVRKLDIEEDGAIEPGGCVVLTSRGDIDERIESQLKRVAAAFEGVDRDGAV